MPEVIFYVLATESAIERQHFACKLIEKIYRDKKFCYVLTDSPQQSQQMDDFLWTFRAGSFVPHRLFQGEAAMQCNEILIDGEPIPENWLSIVINLSSQPPQQFARCDKIVEILDSSEHSRQLGRQRYRFYRQAGLEITTHNMADRSS